MESVRFPLTSRRAFPSVLSHPSTRLSLPPSCFCEGLGSNLRSEPSGRPKLAAKGWSWLPLPGCHCPAAAAAGPQVPGPTALRERRAAPRTVCRSCCPSAHGGLCRATPILCHPQSVTLERDEGDGKPRVPGLPPTHRFMHDRELPATHDPKRLDLPRPSSD